MITGDFETGKTVLRDYVNATAGFQALEKHTRIPAKSLMRMLGPKGNPSAANLSTILTALQRTEGVHFELGLKRLGYRSYFTVTGIGVSPRNSGLVKVGLLSRLVFSIHTPYCCCFNSEKISSRTCESGRYVTSSARSK